MTQVNSEIDMTATAIATQKLDSVERPGWMKVIAPAKVNLFLGIGPRREDGYHTAQSVMHAMNLHDTLYMRTEFAAPGSGLNVEVTCEGRAGLAVPEITSDQNIASKAVKALAARIGRQEDETIRIRIVKNIPFEAGLGGGSSDAAAALVGVARFWGLDVADESVETVAQSLGADVAFFLRGGCGYYEGTGEEFVRSLTPAKTNVVLVKPDFGVCTADAYKVFDEENVEIDAEAASIAAACEAAEGVKLFNNLAFASEKIAPELASIREWLAEQPGVADVLLCGSGSTTFALCESMASACDIAANASKRGWWARTTSLGSARAAVVS